MSYRFAIYILYVFHFVLLAYILKYTFEKQIHMKQIQFSSALVISLILVLSLASCKSNPFGKRVKEPFSGSSYMSNNRYYRATAKASSRDENVAVKKAAINARAELAAQVNSRMKEVSDDFISQKGYENKDEITSSFQSLVRQVTNTDIAALRKIGERKYFNEQEYTVFVAYEIKKKEFYKIMKERAKQQQSISPAMLKQLEEILDKEMSSIED